MEKKGQTKKKIEVLPNREEPLLKVQNLTLGYRDRIVTKDLNFEVAPGDFLCIVSPNGAGKTTLINAILGLIKPKGGKITFGSRLKPTEIGFLPQETRVDLDFPATVLEIVLSGTLNRAKIRPFYGKTEQEIALEKINWLKIGSLKNRSFAELSGGQKQKVLLARALAATTKLLILDEPSNNLDAVSKKDFFSLLKRLNEDRGLTIIMITHDLDHDNLIGNKILAIKERSFFGETADFIKLIHHEKAESQKTKTLVLGTITKKESN